MEGLKAEKTESLTEMKLTEIGDEMGSQMAGETLVSVLEETVDFGALIMVGKILCAPLSALCMEKILLFLFKVLWEI